MTTTPTTSQPMQQGHVTPASIRDDALLRFDLLASAKYDAGQREHGGLITDRNVLEELERELIDAWFYIQALRIKIEAARRYGSLPQHL